MQICRIRASLTIRDIDWVPCMEYEHFRWSGAHGALGASQPRVQLVGSTMSIGDGVQNDKQDASRLRLSVMDEICKHGGRFFGIWSDALPRSCPPPASQASCGDPAAKTCF